MRRIGGVRWATVLPLAAVGVLTATSGRRLPAAVTALPAGRRDRVRQSIFAAFLFLAVSP